MIGDGFAMHTGRYADGTIVNVSVQNDRGNYVRIAAKHLAAMHAILGLLLDEARATKGDV